MDADFFVYIFVTVAIGFVGFLIGAVVNGKQVFNLKPSAPPAVYAPYKGYTGDSPSPRAVQALNAAHNLVAPEPIVNSTPPGMAYCSSARFDQQALARFNALVARVETAESKINEVIATLNARLQNDSAMFHVN